MADASTRIVSLTITEGGYLVNQVTGEFDADAPARSRPDLARGGDAHDRRSGSSSQALRLRARGGDARRSR